MKELSIVILPLVRLPPVVPAYIKLKPYTVALQRVWVLSPFLSDIETGVPNSRSENSFDLFEVKKSELTLTGRVFASS